MSTLFLSRDSLGVRLEGEHLVIRDHAAEAGEKVCVPLGDVERVVVSGEPRITFPVLSAFLERGVACVFLSHGGRWRGELSGGLNFRGERRMLQYRRFSDMTFALRTAERLVAAKVENCRRVLRRLEGNRRGAGGAVRRTGRVVLRARDLSRLRGLEGSLARRHFARLRRFFPGDMGFVRRERHPPRDPANAVLSYLYALLLGDMVSLIRQHGLDPAIGCLHVTDGRRPALALDLMEPFRPICGDLTAVSLCSHRILCAESHFRRGAEGAVLLNDEGRRRVTKAYTERLVRRLRDPQTGEVTRLYSVLERTVTAWATALESGEMAELFRLP